MTHREFLRTYRRASMPRLVTRAIARLLFLSGVASPPAGLAQTVSVTPDGATTTVAPLSKLSYNFTVQNTGGTLTSYSLSARCMPPLSSCSMSPASPIVLGGGASTTVTVSYRSGPGSATGTLALTAASLSATDSGTVSVTSSANPSSGYLSTDTTIYNYSNHRVELCEAGCFAARFSLSTVPYVSGDSPRSVTLVYNGDAVAARPIVSVDASLGAGAPTLQEYWLEAKDSANAAITFVNGDTKLRFSPPSPQTTKVRLSGQFDASAYQTGVYPITLVVTAKYSGSTDSQTIPTRFLVVNGRGEFGNASANSSKNPGEVARGWYWAEYAKVRNAKAGRDHESK